MPTSAPRSPLGGSRGPSATKPHPWARPRGDRACALETRTALLPVGLGVVGLGVVLLARILRLFRRAARAAGLAALRLGRVVALHLASAHRQNPKKPVLSSRGSTSDG